MSERRIEDVVVGLAGLATIMLGVVMLVLQAMVINRLAGIAYPWWSPAKGKAQ